MLASPEREAFLMLRNNDVLGAFELFPDGVAQRDIGKNAPPAGNDDGPRACHQPGWLGYTALR